MTTQDLVPSPSPSPSPSPPPSPSPASPSPLTLLQDAVVRGASIDVIERLMTLAERWQAHQARRAYDAALASAKAELPRIVRSRLVDYTSPRGRTTYRYEDLADVLEALAPVLARHGLAVRWRTDSSQAGRVAVTLVLSHRDGHAEETTLSGPVDETGAKNPMQALGSAVTYLQRYTLRAALGYAAAYDDDGRAAGAVVAEGAESQAPAKPDGYDAWMGRLQQAAAAGTSALRSVWQNAPPGCRAYLHATSRAEWERVKARAARADAEAQAEPDDPLPPTDAPEAEVIDWGAP